MTENFSDSYTTVKLTPMAGAVLDDCIREAIILAFKEGRKVHFVHNEKFYEVIPNNIIASIMGASQAV